MDTAIVVRIWEEVNAGIPSGYPENITLEKFAARIEGMEREACAKVCDDLAKHGRPNYWTTPEDDDGGYSRALPEDCSTSIRERGEANPYEWTGTIWKRSNV